MLSSSYLTVETDSTNLFINGFSFTRHMVNADTIYWRCKEFRALRCPARYRQRRTTGLLETGRTNHNHSPISTRRKRGSLKEILRQRTTRKMQS
uniref:FLYWCH-type domain-containing protein n=2 Tax=Anopheles albimanus TaxID=7167 RepID=A0A182FXA3_ANOAL